MFRPAQIAAVILHLTVQYSCSHCNKMATTQIGIIIFRVLDTILLYNDEERELEICLKYSFRRGQFLRAKHV